jgi:hypothetical protein
MAAFGRKDSFLGTASLLADILNPTSPEYKEGSLFPFDHVVWS